MVELQELYTLTAFCLLTTLTPGPNNLLVLGQSLRYGTGYALRPYFGICLGFPLMVFCMSLIFYIFGDTLFQKLNFIKYLGALFIIYISYKLFTAKPLDDNCSYRQMISFRQSFVFQWINPKAWGMVIAVLSMIDNPDYFFLPSIIYLIVIFPSVGCWLLFGNFIRTTILDTKYEQLLNKIMAMLLASSIVLML